MDVEYLPGYLWDQARGEQIDETAEFHRLLQIGRDTNLIFWWLLLLYGFRLANQFGGLWAGRLAVMLIATEPSFLGHACLASTDIAITAMMMVFTFHYQGGRGATRFRRWVLPGVLYGLALNAKASALTFVPIVMFALVLLCVMVELAARFSVPPEIVSAVVCPCSVASWPSPIA